MIKLMSILDLKKFIHNTFLKKNINKIKENDKIGNFLGWPKMMCSYYT